MLSLSILLIACRFWLEVGVLTDSLGFSVELLYLGWVCLFGLWLVLVWVALCLVILVVVSTCLRFVTYLVACS